MIEPREDAYGAEADTSHLADYVELLAVHGHATKRADLADYLADLKWKVRARELFHSVVESKEPSEDDLDGGVGVSPADEVASRVFELLADRQATLGTQYPFEVTESLMQRREPDAQHDAYLSLLAITLAHHYDVETPTAPERVFEAVVANTMGTRGLSTVDMGAAGRGQGGFRDAVRTAGEALGLVPAPDAAPSRTYANEEGVDTLSFLSWGDTRPGHWIFIGQATCAQSGRWQTKILEPWPHQWGPLLSSLVPPIPYLAVPHHVEAEHMLYLTSGTHRLVLDRLRLVAHMEGITAAEQEVIDAVVDEGAYRPQQG